MRRVYKVNLTMTISEEFTEEEYDKFFKKYTSNEEIKRDLDMELVDILEREIGMDMINNFKIESKFEMEGI